MAVVETIRYRLRAGVEVEAFLDSDSRFQAGFSYQQPGLIRRTTARGAAGEWLAVEIWDSENSADAALAAFADSPLAAEHMGFVEDGSVTVDRYETLD